MRNTVSSLGPTRWSLPLCVAHFCDDVHLLLVTWAVFVNFLFVCLFVYLCFQRNLSRNLPCWKETALLQCLRSILTTNKLALVGKPMLSSTTEKTSPCEWYKFPCSHFLFYFLLLKWQLHHNSLRFNSNMTNRNLDAWASGLLTGHLHVHVQRHLKIFSWNYIVLIICI